MDLKKTVIIGLLMLLLPGCGAQTVFETVADDYKPVALPAAAQISLHLPDEQAQLVMENDDKQIIYLYEDYCVSVQTASAGNIGQTLKNVTGFDQEDLMVIQMLSDGCQRYQCVWTSAGENGEQVGRACILDDGNYHYVVTVMGSEDSAGEMTDVWQDMLDSFDIF